jgi:hypothetical protein
VAGHDGLDNGEAHARAAGVAVGGEEGVEDFFAVRLGIESPSLLTVILTVAPGIDRFEAHGLRVVTDRIIGQV